MRARTQAAGVFALAALVGCSNPPPQTVTLENGVVLPILEGVRLQPKCEVAGFDDEAPKGAVCLEYPRSLSEPPNEDVQNRYAKLLTDKGFMFEGGASIQYWFSWSTRDGCARPFNIASVPKTQPPDGGDWSTVKTFVLVMGFEPESCERPKT